MNGEERQGRPVFPPAPALDSLRASRPTLTKEALRGRLSAARSPPVSGFSQQTQDGGGGRARNTLTLLPRPRAVRQSSLRPPITAAPRPPTNHAAPGGRQRRGARRTLTSPRADSHRHRRQNAAGDVTTPRHLPQRRGGGLR
ncbi:hypothetical protein NDU88_000702 [Pleurodeles waltl]|uniref:Uncharacterized protein n=1 Tax=Pleurodeles waltl TaxID=8319 RepID=A0AAV7M610_PLEWA|nr:hypothetical protein NDU88_000702 [Pleurodeles waltl]